MNPDLIGLVVVDRIPLVDQHTKNIQRETGLKTMGLHGHSITRFKIEQVKKKQCQVLVITAGALVERDLPMSLFHTVVIDECHHAVKNHPFAKLLDTIATLPTARQPRILGLTATPINASDQVGVNLSNLESFLRRFTSCQMICPDLSTEEEKPIPSKFYEVPLSSAQKDLHEAIFRHVLQKASQLGTGIVNAQQNGGIDSWTFYRDLGLYMHKFACFRGPASDRCGRTEEINQILAILAAMEVNVLMGTKQATKILAETSFDVSNISLGKSPRLQTLVDILKSNSDSKTIIFTVTKDCALRLWDALAESCPDSYPRRVVGHGGRHGMLWEGPKGQGEAIDVSHSFCT